MGNYPSEEELETIEKWDIKDSVGVLRYIADLWAYPDSAGEVRDGIWSFATGGWSGNEDLMNALRQSEVWHLLSWKHLYSPGGLYIFAIGKNGEKEFEKLTAMIVKWAREK